MGLAQTVVYILYYVWNEFLCRLAAISLGFDLLKYKTPWTRPILIDEKDVASLLGKLAIVTGGNTGIGYQTALFLLRNGCTVVLACRSLEKAQRAKDEMLNQCFATPPSRVIILQLDTGSLVAVRGFVQKLKVDVLSPRGAGFKRIDYLVNNAGMIPSKFELSQDGFELTYATNVLGSFLLTNLLIPFMSTNLVNDTNDDQAGKIVIVSSAGTYISLPVSEKDLNCQRTWCRTFYSRMKKTSTGSYKLGWVRGMLIYCQSKAMNSIFGYELIQRLQNSPLYASSGIDISFVHPGLVTSDLWNRDGTQNPLLKFFYHLVSQIGISTEEAAQNVVWALLCSKKYGGEGYLLDGTKKKTLPSFISLDEARRQRIWKQWRIDSGMKDSEGL